MPEDRINIDIVLKDPLLNIETKNKTFLWYVISLIFIHLIDWWSSIWVNSSFIIHSSLLLPIIPLLLLKYNHSLFMVQKK